MVAFWTMICTLLATVDHCVKFNAVFKYNEHKLYNILKDLLINLLHINLLALTEIYDISSCSILYNNFFFSFGDSYYLCLDAGNEINQNSSFDCPLQSILCGFRCLSTR